MGKRGSSSNDFESDDNGEVIVDLETEPVATGVSSLQVAADALANQLCAEKPVKWASVGLSTTQRVMYISYGVPVEFSDQDAMRCASDAVTKLHGQGLFPDTRIANISVRPRKEAPMEKYFEDKPEQEPAAEFVGTLISRPEANEEHLVELEQQARALVRTLRAVGERSDADSIDRVLAGGTMSLERLRALRQQLILLRGSHTPTLLGDERQVENLVRQANLAVARFPGTANDLLGGPDSRRRLQKRQRE
jgi:hypothetical protein